jgi:hypothetical protein
MILKNMTRIMFCPENRHNGEVIVKVVLRYNQVFL